jgi:hypothetical protein
VSPLYRLRQLRNNLAAPPLAAEASAEVAAVLSEPERALFARFSAADQWHSYRVFRALRDAGYNQPELAVAALLHDVGKTRYPLSAWERTVIVVGQALFPRRAERWGLGPPASWRRPFVVRAQHPAWGAEMVTAVGSSPAAVDLIRRHQDDPADGSAADPLLTALRWADNRN